MYILHYKRCGEKEAEKELRKVKETVPTAFLDGCVVSLYSCEKHSEAVKAREHFLKMGFENFIHEVTNESKSC